MASDRPVEERCAGTGQIAYVTDHGGGVHPCAGCPDCTQPIEPNRIASATDSEVVVFWRGKRHTVKDIGVGHPWHTITEKGGRAATDTEVALARLLAGSCAEDD